MRGEKIDVFLCFTSAALSPSLSLSLPSAIPLQLHHLLCLTSAQGDGVHSRETNPRQLLSLPCSIHFLLFSSLCFFAVVTISSLSLPRFILLFLSFISYFYFLGHIRIIYIISLTPLAFGLFRPEQVTNRTVCLCVLRARLCVCGCVWVCLLKLMSMHIQSFLRYWLKQTIRFCYEICQTRRVRDAVRCKSFVLNCFFGCLFNF